MIEALERAAEAMAKVASVNGYGFADVPAGRVRVHIAKGRNWRGEYRYFLNNVPVSRVDLAARLPA